MRTLIATWLVVAMSGSVSAQAPPTLEELNSDWIDCAFTSVVQAKQLNDLRAVAAEWPEFDDLPASDQMLFIASIEQAASVQQRIRDNIVQAGHLLDEEDESLAMEIDTILGMVRQDQAFANSHIVICLNMLWDMI